MSSSEHKQQLYKLALANLINTKADGKHKNVVCKQRSFTSLVTTLTALVVPNQVQSHSTAVSPGSREPLKKHALSKCQTMSAFLQLVSLKKHLLSKTCSAKGQPFSNR